MSVNDSRCAALHAAEPGFEDEPLVLRRVDGKDVHPEREGVAVLPAGLVERQRELRRLAALGGVVDRFDTEAGRRSVAEELNRNRRLW